jgi:hypothetical protein
MVVCDQQLVQNGCPVLLLASVCAWDLSLHDAPNHLPFNGQKVLHSDPAAATPHARACVSSILEPRTRTHR